MNSPTFMQSTCLLSTGDGGNSLIFIYHLRGRSLKRAEQPAEQIRVTAQDYEDTVIKDARFCLTLPAWLKYGANVERILICLRDPIQVAHSIQKRNTTTINHGYYLWCLHNTRILENSGDVPVWYINYCNLLNPKKQVKEISRAFQFMGYNFSQERIRELMQMCVKPSMNHNTEVTAAYPPKVQSLWDNLMKIHAAQANSTGL